MCSRASHARMHAWACSQVKRQMAAKAEPARGSRQVAVTPPPRGSQKVTPQEGSRGIKVAPQEGSRGIKVSPQEGSRGIKVAPQEGSRGIKVAPKTPAVDKQGEGSWALLHGVHCMHACVARGEGL
jgi:hypothetical protein